MANELSQIAKPADRCHQVVQWVLAGQCEHDIAEAIEATWPDAKARPLIVAAMRQIAKSADADPAVVRGWCFEATKEIYRRALDVADHQTALRALKQLADLSGK